MDKQPERTHSELDVEGHRLASNDNETIVVDEPPPTAGADSELDVEGHRLATNDNETIVVDEPPPAPEVQTGA